MLVTRELDGGGETVRLSLPAVITADLRLNERRYVTLPNIMKANKKSLRVVTPAEMGVDVASGLPMLNADELLQRGAGIRVADVAALLDKQKKEAKVLQHHHWPDNFIESRPDI